MNDQQKRDIIFNKVWQACDTFRGVIDPAMYKDYILTMLFVKYLSDIHQSKRAAYEEKYKGDPVRIGRALAGSDSLFPVSKSETGTTSRKMSFQPLTIAFMNAGGGPTSAS